MGGDGRRPRRASRRSKRPPPAVATPRGVDASGIVVRMALHIIMMSVRTTSRFVVEQTPQGVEVALNAMAPIVKLIADNDVFV